MDIAIRSRLHNDDPRLTRNVPMKSRVTKALLRSGCDWGWLIRLRLRTSARGFVYLGLELDFFQEVFGDATYSERALVGRS